MSLILISLVKELFRIIFKNILLIKDQRMFGNIIVKPEMCQ